MRDGVKTAYTKGSPEKILAMCGIDDSLKKEIESGITGFQEKACRVIAFAHKEICLLYTSRCV